MEVCEEGTLIIVGAGGLGRDVLDIVEAVNRAGGALEFCGFLDDALDDDALLRRRGARVLGRVDDAGRHQAFFVIGIGKGDIRREVDRRVRAFGLIPAAIAHPHATLGSEVSVGAGCVVGAGARVGTNVSMGVHVHLRPNCTVGHDARLGDYVSVFPGATVSGGVVVGASATIGTGANVLPGVAIGESAFVGAGAVVTKDVESGQTVVGSPAKPIQAR